MTRPAFQPHARRAPWVAGVPHALAALLLAGSFMLAWQNASAAQPTIEVPTLRLQAGGPGAVLEWEGRIEAVQQSTVAAQVAGNLTALLVKAGDTVKAGQALARIDARETQAGLSRSQAEVAQAEAQLTNARLQWERTQSLKAQGFVSASALDSAQAQLKAAQAGLAAAQAGRAQASLAKGFTTVNAPFDGKVLATQAQVGDLAAPGRPILTLYAPRPLRAVVQIPGSQADHVRSARAAEVALPSGSVQGTDTAWVTATRVVALPGADPVSQTVEWRLDLPDVPMLPGQTVRVRFAGMTEARAASGLLTVPTQAVLQRGELTAVYVVREGRFVLQAVRTMHAAPGASQVTLLSGVRVGDVIAANAIQAGLANAKPMKP